MSSEKSRLFRRRLKKQLKTLTALLGLTAVILAAAVWGLSFQQNRGSREKIHEVAAALGIAGSAFLAIHILFFTLPQMWSDNRSPSRKRRNAIYNRGVIQTMRDRRAFRNPPPAERAVIPPVRHDGGSVLVVVLAALAAVAALVLQVQLTARARLRSEEASTRRSGLMRAATDAARAALQRLADDPELLFDGRDDNWARREETRTPEGIATLVTVTDENRFFDLNNSARRADVSVRQPDEIVMNILNGCGEFDAGPCVRALHDWTDEDSEGARESRFYEDRTPPYSCPNRPLLTTTELFDVEGWSPSLFTRRPASSLRGAFNASLGECVTVIPAKLDRVMPINVNTAGRDVLLGILGLEQDVLANAILSMRSIQPVPSIDAIQQLMEPSLFAQVSPYLAVRSDYFRIEARAFADGASATVRALAHRDAGGAVGIMQWMQ